MITKLKHRKTLKKTQLETIPRSHKQRILQSTVIISAHR